MTPATTGTSGPRKQSVSFRVPRWCPPSVNPYLSAHWSKVDRMKRQLADLLGVYARAAGLLPATHAHRPVRRLSLTVIGWGNGETIPDPDNVLKLFLDGCTRAGIIVDDLKDWCKWSRPVLQRGSPDESIVTVTDLAFRPACKPEDDPHTRRLLAALKRKLTAAPRRKANRGKK